MLINIIECMCRIYIQCLKYPVIYRFCFGQSTRKFSYNYFYICFSSSAINKNSYKKIKFDYLYNIYHKEINFISLFPIMILYIR